MPELPDLLYIRKNLQAHVQGHAITGVTVRQPVVLRVATQESYGEVLPGRLIRSIDVHGPFLRFVLSGGMEIIMNLMLAGRLQHQHPGERSEGHLCVSLSLDDGSFLHVCDDQKMAKVYIVRSGEYSSIPKFTTQGIDILSPGFTRNLFRDLLKQHSRKQVRVCINDHTILSAIGNAYADEILFEAGIHPKTFVARLGDGDQERLFDAITGIMQWGVREVERASAPIQVKVRDHMRVRNRRGEPCPRCGATIRREGVRGHDVFFCPQCQPASRALFLDWRKI
jgi:formamidopyrimidine-DNA glycosylase